MWELIILWGSGLRVSTILVNMILMEEVQVEDDVMRS